MHVDTDMTDMLDLSSVARELVSTSDSVVVYPL